TPVTFPSQLLVRSTPLRRLRARVPQEDQLAEFKNDRTPHPWLNRKRAAAIGFGVGATLALSPFVWAENPPIADSPSKVSPAVPQTLTSPVALIQQQSFAPLVRKVSPAVVNKY